MLLWHYAWVILLSGIILGGACFAYSKFLITPLYESTTKVYILNKKENNANLTSSDLQLGSQLTKDYAELIKSRNGLEQVIINLQLENTYTELLGRLAVTTTSDTRILSIVVTDPSPEAAQQIADEIRNVASVHITNVMDIEAVNIVDYANYPREKASPSVGKWTLIGCALGMLLAIGVLVLKYILDDTVKTSEDVEKFLQMSTLRSEERRVGKEC